MIFSDFLKVKIYENMLQNAPNCTIQKNVCGEACPAPNPPSKRMATPRVASPPSKKKWLALLGKSCISP